MIRTILVALDGSARAPGVFGRAAEMAALLGAMLHPFRAIFVPPEFPAAAAGTRADPLPARLTQRAYDDLADVMSQVPSGTVTLAPPIVRVGQPWRLIIDVSDEIDADLIVLGSHGYHGFDRVLGTTAARVANMAHRDVLVVHERADGSRERDTARPPPYRQRA